MAALKEWVRQLVLLVIVGSALELLLPMSSMKRFVRMAMGLLIVLGIVRPIAGLLGQPVAVDPGLLVSDGGALPSVSQIMADGARFRQRSESLLLEEASARLAAEARAAARQVDGVADATATVRLVAAGDQIRVEGVTVTVLPGSKFGQVRPVEPVRPGGASPPATGGPGSDLTGAEPALADAIRREIAARLGLTSVEAIQVLVEQRRR